jgi:glycosyltransferase involved in cell wall biosynthesis
MRVVHLDSGKEMRGGQWQVLSLLEGLGKGHRLMTASGGPLMREAMLRGIEVDPLTIFALAKAAHSADLVHAHDARCHTWAAACGGAPLVVARRVAFAPGRSPMSRWKYARPSRYIAVSKFVRATLIQAGVPEEKIDVIYDGVRLPASLACGSRVIAPSTSDPMKGSDLVREAAAIAGVPIGFSDDLKRDLPQARLLVYVTRSEGLGSAALLAMAHGVPVVASAVGGLPEIVVGALAENQPESIASAIRRVMNAGPDLGLQARRVVEERFTVDRMVEETVRVYERAVTS